MKCCICKQLKEDIEFVWKNAAKGIRHEVCKLCQREKSKQHYHANKRAYSEKKTAYVNQVLSKMREYKTAKGCIDCGESDFRCLDFDHLDPITKVGNVAALARGWSFKKLLTEIDKCVVRCSNCHRKRTYDSTNGSIA